MAERELSADEIEQAGRILMPLFREGVRKELHALRNQFQQDLLVITARVDVLERLKGKAMVGWSVLVLGATLGFNWLVSKFGLTL